MVTPVVEVKEFQESHESEMAEEQMRLDGKDDANFVKALKALVDIMLKG